MEKLSVRGAGALDGRTAPLRTAPGRAAWTPIDPTQAEKICLRGARAICAAVGENPKQILELVLQRGLPAWKSNPRGCWRALPEDLKEWLKGRRDECRARMIEGQAVRRSGPFTRESA